jgi:RIO kinase 1
VFGVSRKDIEKRFDRQIEAFGIRIKDEDQLKVRQDVFDETTLVALYRLANKKVITSIGGVISTGKEANIFIGERGDQLSSRENIRLHDQCGELE